MPRFTSSRQREQLAASFQGQGEEYDRLRPGYPEPVIDAILTTGHPTSAVDLGAGTGKLSCSLARRGLDVVAVDPSDSMLQVAATRWADGGAALPGAAGSLRTQVGTAEATGLPDHGADLVTVAQAWHWFDPEAACAEITRVLRPCGVLGLLWNTLDVSVPWVHRLSRIMHAGDVHKEEFEPPMTEAFSLQRRVAHFWKQPMSTPDLVDLARTRSYVISAAPHVRDKVLANLDWYIHDLYRASGTAGN
jgi:ubiquinone/menaquinone biosynthesis C-methylase UbiE